VKELPGKLKGDKGLTRACSECKKDTVFFFGDGGKGLIDGIVLIVASFPRPALVFKGYGGEAIPPEVWLCKGLLP